MFTLWFDIIFFIVVVIFEIYYYLEFGKFEKKVNKRLNSIETQLNDINFNLELKDLRDEENWTE